MRMVGRRVGRGVGRRVGRPGLTSIAVPGAPTIGQATAGVASASVTFTPPVSDGGAPITSYTVTASPGGITADGASSPINVPGLTNGVAYTFTVTAINPAGTGPASGATGVVMPLWLWGVYPLWHHSSTTPNVDGPLSALADMSLGLYPLSQGTGTNQPTRGSGKITFTTDDSLRSTAAALCAFPDNCHAWSFGAIAELNNATPAANECVGSWGSTASNNNFVAARHMTTDKLNTVRSGNPGPVTVSHNSTANMDATRAAYVWQGSGGALQDTLSSYKDGVITASAVNAAALNVTTDLFGLGCLQRTANTNFLNGAIVAAWAMDRVPSAGELAQWNAYMTAGAPARTA